MSAYIHVQINGTYLTSVIFVYEGANIQTRSMPKL